VLAQVARCFGRADHVRVGRCRICADLRQQRERELGPLGRGLVADACVDLETAELGRSDGGASGERVILRDEQCDRLVTDPARLEPDAGAHDERAGHPAERHVHLSADEERQGGPEPAAEAGDEGESRFRACRLEDPRRERVLVDDVDDERADPCRHLGDERGLRVEYLAGQGHESPAVGGEHDTPGRPVEERDAELVLEPAYVPAQCLLGDEQARRRPREVEFLRDDDEGAQQPRIEVPVDVHARIIAPRM